MVNPAQVYREMVREDLSFFKPVTDQDSVINALQYTWRTARNEHRDRYWPERSRVALMIWSGIGLLAYGRLDYLEETLKLIASHPDAIGHKFCRYYVSGIGRLLPIPAGLSSQEDAGEILAWYRTCKGRLRWKEAVGRFELAGEALP